MTQLELLEPLSLCLEISVEVTYHILLHVLEKITESLILYLIHLEKGKKKTTMLTLWTLIELDVWSQGQNLTVHYASVETINWATRLETNGKVQEEKKN